MGRDGWIGIGWPKEYGGQGRSPTEQIVFIEEMARAGAPMRSRSHDNTVPVVRTAHPSAAGTAAA